MFTEVLFTTAKICKQPECLSTDELIKMYKWIRKLCYIYRTNYYSLLSYKKEHILSQF